MPAKNEIMLTGEQAKEFKATGHTERTLKIPAEITFIVESNENGYPIVKDAVVKGVNYPVVNFSGLLDLMLAGKPAYIKK